MKSKLKSLFCWHTCGTIYKQRKDFLEAAKCFQNALRMQPDNLQLLRETASLQIQVRDHTNHTATRFTILKLKSNMIQNWVGFTLAHHLVDVGLCREETLIRCLRLYCLWIILSRLRRLSLLSLLIIIFIGLWLLRMQRNGMGCMKSSRKINIKLRMKTCIMSTYSKHVPSLIRNKKLKLLSNS